ncbi:lamin tail domain-containing protein [Saccharicrinis sp. FJH62]|uniref:lamin tail domain-containing protein n=1 Tax=Saccharicrinis sp. FJH62 TaxID=3344657 RepID=UPI0035D46271
MNLIFTANRLLKGIVMGFMLMAISFGIHAQTLRINEFLALNQTSITDEDGDYSDWIEIYNPTSGAINLQEWALTDDAADLKKWVFPDITLEPDQYLVVFASGKDRTDPAGELHTNFKLSGNGEYLALVNPSGVPVTAFDPSFPVQETDVSYGYFDGAYVSFTVLSPGTVNPGSGSSIIPAPEFSRNHGFYDSAFDLTISSNVGSAKIYYTTDGSEPTESNGTLYVNPIHISTTTVLRASAFVTGQTASKINTQTYLFVDDIIHQPNNPAGYPDEWGPFQTLSGNAPADYEVDPELVADPEFAASLKVALKELPAISIVTKKENFFSHDYDEVTGGIYIYTGFIFTDNPLGRDWERPISFELFDNKDSLSLQVDCGITINGGHSRLATKNPKHSFRLKFKSEYGPSRLNFPIFGEDADDSFNTLILRGGFNNTWVHGDSDQRERSTYHRDAWGKDMQRAMGHPSGHALYTHLFINGLYWGIYTVSERMDKDFAASYMKGSDDEFDVIKDYSEVMDGSGDAWNELISTVNAGTVSDATYQKLQGNNPDGSVNYNYKPLLDMDNLIDYMLINMYGANSDWDHHNWAAMYNRVYRCAGYKFLVWDAEHILEGVNDNVTSEFNSGCPSNIFQNMMKNELFKRRFADRAYKYLFNDGLLTPDKTVELWMKRYVQIEDAIDGESARWGDYRRDVHSWSSSPYLLYTKASWLSAESYMQNTYFPQRTAKLLQQFKSAGFYPNIDVPQLYLNNTVTTGTTITRGDVLTMQVANGEIYYTTDGSDPIKGEVGNVTEEDLVSTTNTMQVLVPESGFSDNTWNTTGFDASSWENTSGSAKGVGYEANSGYESMIAIDVADKMYDGNTTTPNSSCLVRYPFTISDLNLNDLSTLTLAVQYDDGFAAYLNGQLVAGANAPSSLTFTSAATGSHEAASFEIFSISANINLLKQGENVLAVQGLNRNTSSSDFYIKATLKAGIRESDSGSEMADVYSGPITLSGSAHVKARTYYNNEWSALSEAFFSVQEDLNNLRITEINYHPEASDTVDGDKFEFLELKNIGDFAIDMSGVQIIKGISYVFPEGTYLEPGGFIVLASDEDDFFNRYGFMPFGEYDGQLDNNGERILVATATNDTICDVRYFDDYPWPVEPDGYGYSLVPVKKNPLINQDSSVYWTVSSLVNGSPGRDDPMSVANQAPEMPEELLTSCYPNPFNNRMTISFELQSHASVQLSIRSVTGQVVRILTAGNYSAGTHLADWDGTTQTGADLPDGVYFYELKVTGAVGTQIKTGKIIRIR